MEEFVATFQATKWRNESQDCLIGFTESGDTIVGPAEPIPQAGGCYRFFGKWTTSPKYGKQFRYDVFTEHMPLGRGPVIAYLTKLLRGTGVGKVAIDKIWDKYESDSLRMLREYPKRVAEECGIAAVKLKLASDRLAKHKKSENTMVELIGLFNGRGFSQGLIRSVINKWGSRAPVLIRRDPYLLMTHRFQSAGFARCDKMYVDFGLDPSKLKRQTICLWNVLAMRGTGDTWHPYRDACELLRQRIGGADAKPKEATRLGKRAKWIETRRDVDGNGWLAVGKSARNEREIAERIFRMTQCEANWPEPSGSLSPHQEQQVKLATAGAVGILSGTPGTGKTYSAASLIRSIINKYGHGAIAVLAPTGKAAVRATESLSKAGIVGLTAMTIHRSLVPSRGGFGSGEWGFHHNERDPLPHKFIIVDETSMVDTDLMASLLRALGRGTNLLLIGDPYQLPPVGHGAPFRDLIASNIPHGHLTEIQRNSGLIVKGCAAIREERRVDTCHRFDDEGNNLRIVPTSSPAKTMEIIRAVFEAVVRKGARDPIEDLQILVAMNEQGALGRKTLNTMLQGILNPNGKSQAGIIFRVGDKVICTSNGWYTSDKGHESPEFLANGDIGRVIGVDDKTIEMRFPSIGDGDRIVRISTHPESVKKFELAYAITCHKSQGSEWPVVIILADETASRVASREWWYTAISRAKDRCLVIGKQSVMEKQARRQLLDKRKTFLVELITEEREQWAEAQRMESMILSSVPSPSPSTHESSSLSDSLA